MLWDRYGKSLEIQMRGEGNVDTLLREIFQRAPGVIAGYDEQLNAAFTADYRAFARAVDEFYNPKPESEEPDAHPEG